MKEKKLELGSQKGAVYRRQISCKQFEPESRRVSNGLKFSCQDSILFFGVLQYLEYCEAL